jgi:uncharacterized membrane protein YfcA
LGITSDLYHAPIRSTSIKAAIMHPHPNRPEPVGFTTSDAPHNAVFSSRLFRYWLYFQISWVTLAVLWLSTSHHLPALTGYSGETPAWVSGLLSAMLVGMAAQLVDGALGMAYGVTATTFLIANGASPAAASASVHIAEVFTTGASGWSHYSLGNVNKKLFWRLLVPGLIGVTAGALLLSHIDGAMIKPYISAYLLGMGGWILYRAFVLYRRKKAIVSAKNPPVAVLAITGGFLDAVGGGGWGPVVTTNLIGTGQDPRTTIGTVNSAEFFLSVAGAGVFTLFVGITDWYLIAGLVLGGLGAAPLAAQVTSRLSARSLLLLVGVLISLVSAFNLYKALL